jgi:hypothetical protein
MVANQMNRRKCLLSKRQSCSAASSAAKSLNIKVILMCILEFIQAKNHSAAQCVTNLLHREAIWLPTVDIFILKKLNRLKCSIANNAVNPLVGKVLLIDI